MERRTPQQVERLVRFAEMCIEHTDPQVLSSNEKTVFVKAMVDGWKLAEIAEALGLTRERVRQILEKAMRKVATYAYMQKRKFKEIVEEL